MPLSFWRSQNLCSGVVGSLIVTSTKNADEAERQDERTTLLTGFWLRQNDDS
jgi:hypothetical protein